MEDRGEFNKDGEVGGRPLRDQTRSIYQSQQIKKTSPLRQYNNLNEYSSQQQDNTLRQRIAQKERQLEEMRMATEALKKRLSQGSSSESQLRINSISQRQQNQSQLTGKMPPRVPVTGTKSGPLRPNKSKSPPKEEDVDLYPSRPATQDINQLMKRMDSIGKKYFEKEYQQDTMDQINPHGNSSGALEDRPVATQPAGSGGVQEADKIKILQIDTQSLRRRLAFVEQEIIKVRQDFDLEVQKLNEVANKNSRMQIIIRDDQEVIDQCQSEYAMVQKQKLQNEVLAKDIEIINEEKKNAKDKLSLITSEIDKLQSDATQYAQSIDICIEDIETTNQKIIGSKIEIKELQETYDQSQIDQEQVQIELEEFEEKFFAQKKVHHELMDDYVELRKEADNQQAILSNDVQDIKDKYNFSQKQLVAHLMFKLLEQNEFNQKHEAMMLMREYSTFEKKCNISLRKLAIFIYKRAQKLQQEGLTIWFKNSLKPKHLSKFNEDLFMKQRNKRLMHKAFFEMVSQLQVYKDKQSLHGNAAKIIEQNLIKHSAIERKRAMKLWKQYCMQQQNKENKIRSLIYRCYTDKLNRGFQQWRQWSLQINHQCYLELLRRQFVQNMYVTSIHSELTLSIKHQKHLKLTKMIRIWKCWVAHVRRKRLMVQLNVQAIKFKDANRMLLLQQCYSAMRIHKETSKETIIGSAIQNEMDRDLEQLGKFIARKKKIHDRSTKRFQSNVMRDMLGKRLYGYFQKWKEFTEYKRNMIYKRFKDQVLKVYKGKLSHVFEKWKTGANNRQKKMKKKKMMMIEQESESLKDEVAMTATNNRSQGQAVSSSQQKKTTKHNKLLVKRYQKNAILRWQQVVHEERDKEEKASRIMQKMRRNFVKQAFLNWKNQYKKEIKLEFNQERMNELVNQFNTKKMRKIYHAWQAYNHVNRENAELLRKFLMFMLNIKKRKTFQQWKFACQLVVEDKIRADYENLGQNISLDNQQLAQYVDHTDKQKIEFSQIEEKRLNNARRQLKNYMMRIYDKNLEKGFRVWKSVYIRTVKRNKLIKGIMVHYLRKHFELALLAFKNNAHIAKKKVKKRAVFEMQLQCEEQQNFINKNEEEAVKHKAKVMEKIEVRSSVIKEKNPKAIVPKANIEITEEKVEKLHKILINKTWDKFFISKKRSVFAEWRNAILVQRHFMNQIRNVITKGLYQKGFNAIVEGSRHNHQKKLVEKVLTTHFLTRYYKSYLRQAFNLWKESEFLRATHELNIVTQTYEEGVVGTQNNMIDIKDQNVKNVLLFFNKKMRFRVWYAWQKIRHRQHVLKYKTSESQGLIHQCKKRKTLQRWFFRVQQTKRFREKWKEFHVNKRFRIKLKVFEIFQWKKAVNNDMANVVGHLEYFMRTKMLDDAFKDIKSFSNSKKMATDAFKRRAAWDIYSLLCQRHEKVSRRYFCKYKHKVQDFKYRVKRLRGIYGKINSQLMHTGFRKWVAYTDLRMDEQEQNEVGPVTELVFEGNRLLKNLIDFMKDEGYTQDKIKEVVERSFQLNEDRLKWAITRWRLAGDPEKRLLIKAFDHLVLAVKFRKAMRYWLNFSNNRVQHVKADMLDAFRKLAISDNNRAIQLDQRNIESLQTSNERQGQKLREIAEKEQYDDAVIKHLSHQRDELLAHYIRGQKLALSMCHNNHIKAKGKFFSRWASLLRESINEDSKQQVLSEIDKLTEKKEQARALEQSNLQMADENDELRKFSIDGFNIAKSINSVTEDRENLTSDLADYADQIKTLLQRNQQLKKELEEQFQINEQIRQMKMQARPVNI